MIIIWTTQEAIDAAKKLKNRLQGDLFISGSYPSNAELAEGLESYIRDGPPPPLKKPHSVGE